MSDLRLQIPHKLEGLLVPKRFKSIHGGRGSGKSHFFAGKLIADVIALTMPRAMQKNALISLRDLQHFTHLLRRPPFDVAQRDDFALTLRQCRDRCFDDCDGFTADHQFVRSTRGVPLLQ